MTVRLIIAVICIGVACAYLQPQEPASAIASALLVIAIVIMPMLDTRGRRRK